MTEHLPVYVKKLNGKYRIIEAQGRIAKTPLNHAVDGGGHKTKAKALRQAGHINSSKEANA